MIVGFINGLASSGAVEIMHSILKSVKDIQVSDDGELNGDVLFNAGVYREWRGSEVERNIDVAKKLMVQVSDGISGHVGFLRNSDHIVTDIDYDRRGYLRADLISVVM
jgi:hypothetical protein